MENVLLISEKTLKSVTLINNNVDNCYLAPAIRMVQEIDLELVIGPVLVHKLENLVGSGDIQKDQYKKYKYLLDSYITNYMCWAVMSAILININYKLTNSGVVQNQDDKKSAMDLQANKSLQAQYDKYANAYAMKLKNYLCNHVTDYPEYKQCEDFQHEGTPMLCSIFLEDRDCHNYIGK